ncbi:hypothetical protein RRF57_008190 [Xylaria bambusicola]|uniref:NadR/Ttd14 AAA domain-containing protein n=1 Tax=Xylaria bambusicola TaxID=326684 RepID=A0AAN7UTK5_9PEZI
MTPSVPSIYIIGSQCTGKTTLVTALSDYFQHHPITSAKSPAVIKEVARSVLEAHGFNRGDIRNSQDRALELQRLIIEAQSKAERSQLETSSWFISDRSAVDPIIYARKYVSKKAAAALASSPEWLEMSDRMAKSLVIVCEAGVDWLTDDGVRLMPQDTTEWKQTHAEFCAVLDDMGLRYHVLPARVKDMNVRVQFVLTRWEELAAAHRELCE